MTDIPVTRVFMLQSEPRVLFQAGDRISQVTYLLGLDDGPGESVQQESLLTLRFVQRVVDQLDHHLITHQFTLVYCLHYQ